MAKPQVGTLFQFFGNMAPAGQAGASVGASPRGAEQVEIAGAFGAGETKGDEWLGAGEIASQVATGEVVVSESEDEQGTDSESGAVSVFSPCPPEQASATPAGKGIQRKLGQSREAKAKVQTSQGKVGKGKGKGSKGKGKDKGKGRKGTGKGNKGKSKGKGSTGECMDADASADECAEGELAATAAADEGAPAAPAAADEEVLAATAAADEGVPAAPAKVHEIPEGEPPAAAAVEADEGCERHGRKRKSTGVKLEGRKRKVGKRKVGKRKLGKAKAGKRKSKGKAGKCKAGKCKGGKSKGGERRGGASKGQELAEGSVVVAEGAAPSSPGEEPVEEEAAMPPVAIDIMPEIGDTPYCNKCKLPVDPLRMRLTGKAQGVWQCKTCSVRYTQLHRQWGGWPPREFDMLTSEEKDKFWLSMADSATEAQREQLVLNTLTSKVVESRASGSEGRYLPLGWYAQQGFDADRIAATCTDWEEHPILGRVYRVDINYQDKKKEVQRVKEHILKSVAERRTGKAAKGRAKAKAGQGKGGGGLPRENPAPTVATKKMQGDAVRILAKVSPIVFSLQALLKHKKLSLLPQPHIDKLKEHLQDMSVIEKGAQKTISHQEVLSFGLADVAERAGASTTFSSMLTGLLASF